ncbi:MAG: phenylalanine--tRNA ligase subunit beta [Myxococcales bacterium]|nr:phenylalanine--tRNA ligase subunit beta [Myxococcales bacterium]
MRISWQWLTSLLDLPEAARPSAEGLAAILTSVGLEVDGIERVGEGVQAIIVGEIRGKEPHPRADRLTVVALFDGAETLQVVCGAQNLPPVGGKVAFAPVGARLPNGMEIGAREVRGVASNGMICSETELDIGTDDDGILILPESWPAGARLCDQVPGIVDAILEIGVTPNRPDALGHVGVARDVAVKLQCGLRLPELRAPEVPTEPSLVTIDAPARCGRYLGFVVDGVEVGPSPLWMRVRLHRLGLRAINNCVDITNFVLFEQGQPLHAFDRRRLAEGRVVVRMAGASEPFDALDGSKHELSADDLVIADASIPQALAGVMGGARSMVEAGTSELLLEVAWFQPSGIRASARRHALSSDSSYRFERGVDHGEGLDRAALRALQLLGELAGGTCRAKAEGRGEVPARPRIVLRLARVHHLLGMPVGPAEALRILQGLGVEVEHAEPVTPWTCVAPSHRPDLQREVDLIEELMRFHGLDDLPAEATVPSAPADERPDPRADLRDRLTDALREVGLHELVAYAFTHPDKLRPFLGPGGEAAIVHLQNPLRVPLSVMRTHLIPDLLDALEVNVARHSHPLRLFQVGRVYAWRPEVGEAGAIDPRRAADLEVIDALLPEEREEAAILLHGGEAEDARAAVGALVHALARLGYQPRVEPFAADARVAFLHPGVQARIGVRVDDPSAPVAWVGYAGELHPDALVGRELGGRGRAYVGVIDLGKLPPRPTPIASDRPRFPATSRDLSLEIPLGIAASAVVDALALAAVGLCAEVTGDRPRLAGDGISPGIEVVEEYRGQGVAEGRRALLLRLHYRAEERTLTDAEVQELHQAIVASACGGLSRPDAEVRVR